MMTGDEMLTRAEGMARLEAFIPNCGKAYAQKRNFDFGKGRHQSVSQLSPFVRRRLITEVDMLRAVMSAHRFADAQKFIHEIFWRTYFKGWMEMRPTIWMEFTHAKMPPADHKGYLEAISGQTGIACFDAWVDELKDTNYLHNHARMWFASIWCFTLNLPWQWGADFFYKYLLDADPASNTCSWRWVAGLHTKGKHYLARADNIDEFTKGRFQPYGDLNELAKAIAGPDNPSAAAIDWPDPLADAPYLLCVTAEDSHLESLPLKRAPEAILALPASLGRYAGQARAITEADATAIADAAARAAAHFNVKAIAFDGPEDADLAAVGYWMRAQAETHQLTQLATAQASMGIWKDRLSVMQAHWRADAIDWVQIMRPYDRMCWPEAKKGFFPFKEKIPQFLRDLAI